MFARFWMLSVITILLSSPVATAEPARSDQFGSCGREVRQSGGINVPVGPTYWHGLSECLRSLRNLWLQSRKEPDLANELGAPVPDIIRTFVTDKMDEDRVRFRLEDGSVVSFADAVKADGGAGIHSAMQVNDLGQPYNGMGQSGMAYFLYQLAGLAEDDGDAESSRFYRMLGRASLQTLLDDVDEGGLASRSACHTAAGETCAWYHSITRRDWAADGGGTLNQMLHVVRDMGMMKSDFSRRGWASEPDLTAPITEGLNQLFLGQPYDGAGTSPNLFDFISNARNPAGGIWAWYGFNTRQPSPGQGYFLDDPDKNCSYHAHVLDLVISILEKLDPVRDSALIQAAQTSPALDGFRAAAETAGEGGALPDSVSCSPDMRARLAEDAQIMMGSYAASQP
ncbi:hypothetical protein [Falsirhodobacter sp. alg1]|uniref:hypothetical protein n=1 Tax=Falsirhodobacter sp. alg1 TaxID=1472418 RepID=UPI0005EE0847|nr:hypothetical protein [Falsirhodobacter sp. alg1]